MNKEIYNLEPKEVWKNFYSLTQIPRPSKHEDKIQDFMVKFGKDLGLETIKDEVGNVIIRKPATKGMEDRKGVILQGHLDMVPQKNSDKVHDFVKDPIEAYIDGEWVTANGTTLGSDNGIGVSATMAVLASKTIAHGPLEALFTCDEETGMTGAFGLKPGILKGDVLINMDSEDEGELYIGCAGGIDLSASFDYKEEKTDSKSTSYKLIVKGLKGGHSGVDINLYRGNSNKLLFRFLKKASLDLGLRISSLIGGSLRNAVPRESFATVVIPKENENAMIAMVKQFEQDFKKELSVKEPDLQFYCEKTEMPGIVMDFDTQMRVINAVYATPNGVMRMSDDIKGMVETSTNLAIIQIRNKKVSISALLRSSVESAKDDLGEMMCSVYELAGAKYQLEGGYPGWKPNPNSEILTEMQSIYKNLYGNIPEIKAIHAGLECGLLGSVYTNLDMISFGPTIRFPHSPDEKVNIATVVKFWNFLLATLKNFPKK
ncbi:MAG: cytosol nonspecific dipeptidase [Bacteroidetes bacterium CG2_30_33_31]|nr:MAG: cytosol nonspecific dipeptidase [Bacteroidetes bacterium CG2_30_33_31]